MDIATSKCNVVSISKGQLWILEIFYYHLEKSFANCHHLKYISSWVLWSVIL